MIEVDEAAVHILANVEYWEGLGEPAYPAHAGPAIREGTRSAPSWVNGRPVYHLYMREAHAEGWRDWCEAHGDVLKTFPDQRDREYGEILARAGRAFAEALRVSTYEPSM
jgi:hypothetical protein